MATKNIFTLDDGTKELTIENTFGETICTLHVRTGDISILDRYEAFKANFGELLKPLSDVSIKDNGTSSIDSDWEKIKGVENKLISELNELFDTSEIGKLFEKRNAFSTIGGVFYVEKVIDMLGNVVAEAVKEESEKAQERLAKYTKDVERRNSGA